MKLVVEGKRPVGRPKNIWCKVGEEERKKLNIMEDMKKSYITEDMAEDRQQWRR